MQFDYFYPEQADQYAFYRIPRRLFTEINFKGKRQIKQCIEK